MTTTASFNKRDINAQPCRPKGLVTELIIRVISDDPLPKPPPTLASLGLEDKIALLANFAITLYFIPQPWFEQRRLDNALAAATNVNSYQKTLSVEWA